MAFIGAPIGGFTSDQLVGVENLIPSVQTYVINYENDGNPFMSYFANPNSLALIKTDQVVYTWYENQLDQPNAKLLTAIVNAGAGVEQTVTIDLSNTIALQVFQDIPTGQSWIVTKVSNVQPNVSVDITIKPFPFSGSTTAVASASLIRSLGVLMPQGGFYAPPRGSVPKPFSNICGIQNTSFGIDRTSLNSQVWYDGGMLNYTQLQTLTQMKGDKERYYIYAKFANENYAQTNPSGNGQITGSLRSTDGVFHRITTFADLYSGTLTEYIFDSYNNLDVFGQRNHGANRKMYLLGPDVATDINSFAKQKYRIMEPEGNFKGDYGMDVDGYAFTGGTYGMFFLEREFMEDDLRHQIMTLDYRHVKIRHKRENYIELHPDTQQPNQDVLQTTLVTEDGVQLEAEIFHARLGWI